MLKIEVDYKKDDRYLFGDWNRCFRRVGKAMKYYKQVETMLNGYGFYQASTTYIYENKEMVGNIDHYKHWENDKTIDITVTIK